MFNSSGFFKIWRINKETGKRELVVSKQNMILYQGADLLAKSLAGVPNANVSLMYVGYYNTDDIGSFTPPTIDKQYTNRFQDYNNVSGLMDLGYLRLPLSFTPSYIATTNYNNNVVIFSSVISNNSTGFSGASFYDSTHDPPSYIFEVALVAALNPTNPTGDVIFSRANFTPIEFDSNYNLSISWGINFLS